MLNNTPSSDGVPIEPSNNANSVANRRARTQAAMIGLALSMGATSLLVTRQSDQAQAAAPVGSQKAASTMPAAPDTEMKFAPTTLENQTVSLVSVPENPVIVEPTAISQVPGLEAKLQVAASGMSLPVPASEATAKATTTYKTSLYQQSQVVNGLQTTNKLPEVQKLSIGNSAVSSPNTSLTAVTNTKGVDSAVTAQLKAQQEFALNRLQEKSNRLKESLAELRSEETQNLSQANKGLAEPTAAAVEKAPQINASNLTTEQSPTTTNASQASLIAKLKQAKANTAPVATPVPATLKAAAPSNNAAYEVKPGDTLAAIASKYGTSVSELAKVNHLSNPNQLQISQKLVVPSTEFNSIAVNNPSKLAINPTVEQSEVATSKVVPSPVNTAIVSPTVPVAPQLPVVANNNSVTLPVTPQLPTVANNNSVTVPTPATANNQIPANTAAAETAPTPGISYGMGGDAPVPKIFAELQNQKPQKLASAKSNERLQSLQAEIQRLREKYRAQQAGVVVPVVSENNQPAAVLPVANSNNFATSPTFPRSAIQIPVPSPRVNAVQPMKPLFRATQPTNEPVNPEFFSNQAPGRKLSVPRIATPPRGVNASDSLGKMRGTTVSPSLPPLSAVDQYLPKPLDEAIPPPSSSSVAYIWPAKGVLTSGYGWRWGRMHRGIDVANSTGTPIYASADGVVVKAGWNNGGYGNLVDIRHSDGSMTRYGHNSKILVQAGQQVRQGDTIALMGSTGFSTGPHSHFEIHPTGKGAVNPITLLANRI
ncbi:MULTISPECIES: peptidoglycan DD-metalloendopeptidase family protein [unclassified Tolypothrix]|uniref:peptidoglycan DD-metalloendopeptidase family protein n=1 Tax=unclassified Tolypothrix TaxID=2649714 RepID=UPI001F3E2725|nr:MULTISPECIES: peptidoglycan DD-metalloendopeptidase family protein [unclassified Tolypothrix]